MTPDEIPHGGRLRAAIARYGGAMDAWLDLSTAVAPWSYPLPPVPEAVWQRLPEPDDALPEAIAAYYGAEGLPIPGTQAVLQLLPLLASPQQRVVVPSPSYGEYGRTWALAGHTVSRVPLDAAAISEAVTHADVLLLGQPNNPTGHRWSVAQLQAWHAELAARGGMLLIDEAFADAADVAAGRPSPLPAWAARTPGVVVLRSLGKFFGLAGIRFGVAFAERKLLAQLAAHLGPWAVSHPARWAATLALSDRSWHLQQLVRLTGAYQALQAALEASGWHPPGKHVNDHPGLAPYALLVPHPDPVAASDALARRLLLVRPFRNPPALRFGVVPLEALAELAARLAAAAASAMR